jgi:hypothetical protein
MNRTLKMVRILAGLSLLALVGCQSAAPAPTCTGTSCVCPSGTSCDFSSGGCAGNSCTLACASKNDCVGSCGQSCSLACGGASTCSVTAGPSASISCTGGSTCHITCTGSCSINCDNSSTCDLTCPGKAAKTITGGGSC